MKRTLEPAELRDRVEQAAEALREAGVLPPRVGWIASTGTASLASELKGTTRLPLRRRPGFPSSFAEGSLLCGSLGGTAIAAVEGGPALHSGVSPLEVAFPVWILRALGAEVLLLTAAAGSLDPSLAPGELLLVADHLNASGLDPLRGLADERLGPRFPDLSSLYDGRLRAAARSAARKARIPLREGIVAFRTGPSLETAAERAWLRGSGALGLVHSLVPEAIAAAHAGLRVLALAAATDAAHPEAGAVSIEAMAAASAAAEPRLGAVLSGALAEAVP